MLSYSKSSSVPSKLIIALFLFSASFLINEASAAFRAVLDQSMNYLCNALENAQQPEARSDQWRQNEWNKWEDKLEEEWAEFDENLEDEKDELIKMNEKEWGPWFESTKKKWMNFGKYIDDKYKCEVLKESLYWNEVAWKTWIKTEGRSFIEKDLSMWFASKESYLYRWVSKEWTEWKNEKIKEWFNSKWKREENEYWTKWEEKKLKKSNNSSKIVNTKDYKKWLMWKEKTQQELDNWHEWAEFKDNIYINSNWEKWKQWKNEKRKLFYNWVDSYVWKWIKENQWIPLIEEIKQLSPSKAD
ncbi:tryptophan-rich antigen, putative [Plasmodium knowlesi strain H]|uniref:Tryptophan-rich antigen, putative n=3 Tax=Plasmodium knowlesi TaxID=5850 RepID=A0A1A7VP09_PLAKH|nr:tryptophan-rich antigen [Plasmodium knowlesi strain H]OTN67577.1 putative Tryptophan-rich antigen [Plasmodium knowlesi]CAA9987294.1 tryptophan-rich antigen [Plasmodium knowlesi strain H]SBO23432.1 tryptophan-rich antigen, putative [Plasmodium knowlesi strain H]SBO24735.1 tryptophan-rich antigen, putative [Plasmodium knowlesi strain H]VVS76768.1 tryptophan-rich antigen [Plasmodium knowlesi strain H]